MATYRPIALALAAAALATASACDSGGPSGAPTTSPEPLASATPIATRAETSMPTSGGPNENGSSPVFWRTADNFQSVVAGKPYLVLFRIDSGYDEPSLTVTAACEACGSAEESTFVGTNSPPIGADSPGSYYPMNVTFPEPGEWELTVHAGTDEVTIPIGVQPAG